MQYLAQSFRIKDPEIKDLFLDIAAEELSHMEMVAQTINLLNGHDVNYEGVEAGEIETHVLSGLAPFLINSSGEPMALSNGMGAEMTKGLAIVSIGGLAYSTILTLVVIPILYDLMQRKEFRVIDIED